MVSNEIRIEGARENNLKGISLTLPKYKLIALTGVSGSGKSTFAMSILQRECQRQYMESMGLVTDGLNKPLVDRITGLSPSIAITQRAARASTRSTVGTYTEILTYMRILYAKLGVRQCETCGKAIMPSYAQETESELDATQTACPHCGAMHTPLTMAHFSFNKSEGACKNCQGVGVVTELDMSPLIDETLTIEEGAVNLWLDQVMRGHYAQVLKKCGEHYGFVFDSSKPISAYNDLEKLVFYDGVESDAFKALYPDKKKPKKVSEGYFKGMRTYLQEKADESVKKAIKNSKISDCIIQKECPVCHGTRLGEEARTVTVQGMTIVAASALTMEGLYKHLDIIWDALEETERLIIATIIGDLRKRIQGIIQIGLGYLSTDRPVGTLSGGEMQRVRLAQIMDSGLTGVLYILDEPTTGLHPRDTERLLNSLIRLRDLGNTIVVIEHDMAFVKQCDYVIDFGPGAGALGGQIIAEGTPQEVTSNSESMTGRYLQAPLTLNTAKAPTVHRALTIHEPKIHNLAIDTLTIPLGQLVTFTGVSGSGKSSLVFDVIAEGLHGKSRHYKKIDGEELVESIVVLNQSPIGRQSRSNIATYTDLYTAIRERFAALPQSKREKLKAADFSFNVKGGRCEKCQGLGVIPLDMQFLDDVEVTCPVCLGKRFKKQVLGMMYEGKSIYDVLEMTVAQASVFFERDTEISKRLQTLEDVGLHYLKLGQSTITLSGGECQRIKLAKELSKPVTQKTLYLLDEPTTGLHPCDIEKLMILLKRLVARGHSVWLIEHAVEVMVASDYIIDMGPEGGVAGGQVMAQGTPQEIIQNTKSITAYAMRQQLEEK